MVEVGNRTVDRAVIVTVMYLEPAIIYCLKVIDRVLNTSGVNMSDVECVVGTTGEKPKLMPG